MVYKLYSNPLIIRINQAKTGYSVNQKLRNMKIGIMQPYFFPYLGYFQLINTVDKFVLFDDVQYIRHGWINRNRILKPEAGWQYIVAPLESHSQKTLIRDIRVKNQMQDWKDRILRQMVHYKKRAPHYESVIALLQKCFDTDEADICRFNRDCLLHVCEYLNISTSISISSELNLDYSEVNDAGEWALKICKQLRGVEYINPVGGKDIFQPWKFSQNNIKLSFLKSDLKPYSQKRSDVFEPGLSIIDVMMFNSPREIRSMLKLYEIERASVEKVNIEKIAKKTQTPSLYQSLFFYPNLLEFLGPEVLEFAMI